MKLDVNKAYLVNLHKFNAFQFEIFENEVLSDFDFQWKQGDLNCIKRFTKVVLTYNKEVSLWKWDENIENHKDVELIEIQPFILDDWKPDGFTGYCHNIVNKELNEKVLIPMCIGVAVYNDLDKCTCKSNYQYDKKKDELIKEIEYLKNKLKENKIKF